MNGGLWETLPTAAARALETVGGPGWLPSPPVIAIPNSKSLSQCDESLAWGEVGLPLSPRSVISGREQHSSRGHTLSPLPGSPLADTPVRTRRCSPLPGRQEASREPGTRRRLHRSLRGAGLAAARLAAASVPCCILQRSLHAELWRCTPRVAEIRKPPRGASFGAEAASCSAGEWGHEVCAAVQGRTRCSLGRQVLLWNARFRGASLGAGSEDHLQPRFSESFPGLLTRPGLVVGPAPRHCSVVGAGVEEGREAEFLSLFSH